MSQPAAPANLNIRVFTQSGSFASVWPPVSHFRSTPNQRTSSDRPGKSEIAEAAEG